MAYNVLTGSGVKLITKGSNTIAGSGDADGGTGTSTDPYYKDVTISAVSDISKTIVNSWGGCVTPVNVSTYAITTTTTNLRVYYNDTSSFIVYYEIIELY